jgi:hypothetical protein
VYAGTFVCLCFQLREKAIKLTKEKDFKATIRDTDKLGTYPVANIIVATYHKTARLRFHKVIF